MDEFCIRKEVFDDKEAKRNKIAKSKSYLSMKEDGKCGKACSNEKRYYQKKRVGF